MFRTDENNNPTAFTTDVAREGGLILGVDYKLGNPFTFDGKTYYTAHLLGNPIITTEALISKIGFYTNNGSLRWNYIGIPAGIWAGFTPLQKKQTIGFMYEREGGVAMKSLFS